MANRECKNKFIRYDCIERARREIGNTYHYIKIVGVSHVRDKQSNILYEAQCQLCNSGETFLVRLPFVKDGKTKSCGCLRSKLAQEKRLARNRERATKVRKWFEVYKGWWIDSKFCLAVEACAGRDYWKELDKMIATRVNPFNKERLGNDVMFSELYAPLVSISSSLVDELLLLTCQLPSYQVVLPTPKTALQFKGDDIGKRFKFYWKDDQLIMEEL